MLQRLLVEMLFVGIVETYMCYDTVRFSLGGLRELIMIYEFQSTIFVIDHSLIRKER